MDPITHGLLGAAAAQIFLQKRLGKKALIAGALSGMAPDLDVFIRSASNPMMDIVVHRHLTHSILFMPFGALIIALLLRIFKSYHFDWIGVYWACLLGYGTHALLDACTSYGTLLLWPFSRSRVFWDCVAIIDPFFTGALILGILFSRKSRRPRASVAALVFCLAFLGFGKIQNRRGLALQQQIIQSRGHITSHSRVMPKLASLITWRSLYEADGRLWADTLRIAPFGKSTYIEGASTTAFYAEELPTGFLENPGLKKDWENFVWFSDGFVARSEHGNLIADMRYSSDAGGFKPLWGILIPEDPQAPHVGWTYFRENRWDAIKRLLRTSPSAD